MNCVQRLPLLLQTTPGQRLIQKNQFWRWVNHSFNNYDKDRVKEVGPERAAAEWLLRCGGSVRWVGRSNFTKDYNSLPQGAGSYHIEAIDGTDSSVDDGGFRHLEGLKMCKEVKLCRCQYMENGALYKLEHIKDTLEHLEIIECSSVTGGGINALTNLTNLKYLRLFGNGVKNMDEHVKMLKSALPKCKIDLEAGPKSEK